MYGSKRVLQVNYISVDNLRFHLHNINKHRRWVSTAFVRTISETVMGLGLYQQLVFCPQKAMLAGT